MFLYIRMIFLLVVNLYASRIILNTLGVEDYGIYNAVGGFVAMFTILSGSLSNAISRYLTFELGHEDHHRLRKTFAISVEVQAILAISIVALSEIIGYWFLNYKMQIPEGRLEAANWVLHCSILTFAVNLISIPYNASIIAHEQMSAFAYISIVEALLKLGAVFALYTSFADKLKLYAILLFFIAVIIRLLYGIYCHRHFEETHFEYVWDKQMVKEMTSFAGWNFIGNGASVLNNQGVNILMNLFFGVTVNAARGIATQVESHVQQFVNNFMTALQPQITKAYAKKDTEFLHILIYNGAKYSYFLMLFFALPICLETESILRLWLKMVPDYSVAFIRLSFVSAMINLLTNTVYMSVLATGNIKKYQLTVGLLSLVVFPLTYVFFKMGFPVEYAYYTFIFIFTILIFVRLLLARQLIDISICDFTRIVIFKSGIVTIAASILPAAVFFFFETSMVRLLVVLFLCCISTIGSVWILGLSEPERVKIGTAIRKKISSR